MPYEIRCNTDYQQRTFYIIYNMDIFDLWKLNMSLTNKKQTKKPK